MTSPLTPYLSFSPTKEFEKELSNHFTSGRNKMYRVTRGHVSDMRSVTFETLGGLSGTGVGVRVDGTCTPRSRGVLETDITSGSINVEQVGRVEFGGTVS